MAEESNVTEALDQVQEEDVGLVDEAQASEDETEEVEDAEEADELTEDAEPEEAEAGFDDDEAAAKAYDVWEYGLEDIEAEQDEAELEIDEEDSAAEEDGPELEEEAEDAVAEDEKSVPLYETSDS